MTREVGRPLLCSWLFDFLSRCTPLEISKLGVVVVESHQYVLEHIHAALRRRRRLLDWTMVHFDSHADLACPNHVPAGLCFRPRRPCDSAAMSLYDYLEASTTGIAEWILPLVLAANLTRIEWIRQAAAHRSACSSSFAVGPHTFTVGVWIPPTASSQRAVVDSFFNLPEEARVKVDSQSPYYADDDAMADDSDDTSISYAPKELLLFPQTVNLHVHGDSSQVSVLSNHEGLWLLDVCLDYFCCYNPFWVDLQTVDPHFANALTRLVHESCLYNNHTEHQLNHDERCKRVRSFRQLIARLINDMTTHSDLEATTSSLMTFYSNTETVREIIASLRSCLLSAATASPNQSKLLIDMAIEALPYLTLPHDHQLEVEERLQQLASFLEQHAAAAPFLVTIARSAYDGFISKDLADQLQQQVCQLVHNTYCSCGREILSTTSNEQGMKNDHFCCIELVLDYSDEDM